MSKRFTAFIRDLWGIDRQEELKVALLTIAFFLIIGAYTLARELKDSLFVNIVGKEYIPLAKIYAMFVLVPPILIFSRLVDLMRKHQLLYVYTVVYGLIGLGIAYFLSHPTIGLANTDTSKYRIFGWFIYFFIEGYSPFVVSLFWAFVNSVTAPGRAKDNYPIMIAGSKIGGIGAALFAWLFLSYYSGISSQENDIFNHQVLLGFSSLLLLLVPGVIYVLMKKVPRQLLTSYEAATQADQTTNDDAKEEQTGLKAMFAGLVLLLRYPYVLGIFGMVFFWEIVNVFFGYERLGVGKAMAANVSDYTRFLFTSIIFMHIIGLVIALFGTRFIITWFGEKKSLALIPITTGFLLVYYFIDRSPMSILIVFGLLRALNYGFTQPLRESLYIPTARDIRFKSKSWIDASGSKAAKAAGSLYNVLVGSSSPVIAGTINGIFFSLVIGGWLITAYFLGRRFERAVKRKEVIGLG